MGVRWEVSWTVGCELVGPVGCTWVVMRDGDWVEVRVGWKLSWILGCEFVVQVGCTWVVVRDGDWVEVGVGWELSWILGCEFVVPEWFWEMEKKVVMLFGQQVERTNKVEP